VHSATNRNVGVQILVGAPHRFIVQQRERLALNQSNLGANPSEPTISEERRSLGGRYARTVITWRDSRRDCPILSGCGILGVLRSSKPTKRVRFSPSAPIWACGANGSTSHLQCDSQGSIPCWSTNNEDEGQSGSARLLWEQEPAGSNPVIPTIWNPPSSFARLIPREHGGVLRHGPTRTVHQL
jgi:hypothetical protein